MKIKLLLGSLLACALEASAQGTLQFSVNLNGANEIPPNASAGFGSGMLNLNGTTLNYSLQTSIIFQNDATPTDITFNGPADTSSTAPMLFDLGAPVAVMIQPPPGGYYSAVGTIKNLTIDQIGDLASGLWYINVFTSSGNFPGGEILCQIVPVPEPSSLALLGTGGIAVLLWLWRRTI